MKQLRTCMVSVRREAGGVGVEVEAEVSVLLGEVDGVLEEGLRLEEGVEQALLQLMTTYPFSYRHENKLAV
jgi:hypothetical protein